MDKSTPPKINCFCCNIQLADDKYKIKNTIVCYNCFLVLSKTLNPSSILQNKDNHNNKDKEDNIDSNDDSDDSDNSDNSDDDSPPFTPPHIPYIPDRPPPLVKKKIFMVMINKDTKNNKAESHDNGKNKKGKEKDKRKENDEDDGDKDDEKTPHDENCGCNEGSNEKDGAQLFFESLINSLNGIDRDNSSGNLNFPSRKSKTNTDNKNKDIEEDESTLEYEWLGAEIKDIDDLIRIGESYNPKKRKRHNLNIKMLNSLVVPLTELKNMIGMTDVKKIIFDQIIYYLQKLDDKNVDMLHTVIVGPPGVGKTQLTHIIAKIYNKLGFLKTDKVICAKRDDLIAEYVGQTAPKTRKVLEKALGGVLLLDEVYSLSPTSDRDFAKEAIDMINMYLSEHCHDMVCVVAGYKKPTYEKFMAQNEGLARRFTHHFEIKGYTPEELTLIFKKYVEEQKWAIGEPIEVITSLIEKNIKIFPNFGGDMTTLFSCCKKTHSRRLLLIPTEKELIETKKKFKIADIEAGIVLFKEIKEKNSSGEEEDKEKYQHMYS